MIKAIEQEGNVITLITDNDRFNVAELIGKELSEEQVAQVNSIMPNLIPDNYVPYTPKVDLWY